MKEKLKFIIGLVMIVVLLVLIGMVVYRNTKAASEEVTHPIATFEVQDYGTVKMELYPEYAPNTVSNFIALIEAGYYQNKVVYGKDDVCLYLARAPKTENAEESEEDNTETAPTVSSIDSSVEAGSDGDYKYEINGEFISNGFEQNTLRHEKGVLSLNRSDYSSYGLTEESYNSGSAQFSVMMQDSSTLNGVYCAFGKVIEGLDILEKIYNEVEVATQEEGEEHNHEEDAIQEFASMPVITNATVEKYEVDYGKPEVHEAFDVQSYINDLYSQYYSN